MEQSEDSTQLEGDSEHTQFRDGHLFVVDLIPEMFNVDVESNETYFEQCLQVYGRILSQKLSLNRRDWMGLVFFPCNEWDMDPETKHILTIQKFEEITTPQLVQVMEILSSKVDHYKRMYNESDYPLHDVLWHAARCFDSVKVTMGQRQIILVTCRDDPFAGDEPERHRIRLRAKTFSDINVKLQILGLGNNWSHDLFYRDIESLANKIESKDVKRILMEDLEYQIKNAARTMAHIPLRIGEGLHIRTVISPFSGTAKYLKEVKMCKETNEVLEIFRHLGKAESQSFDDSDEEEEDLVSTQAPDSTRKGMTKGGELISFGQREIKEIRMPLPSGIDLLGFKETSYDSRYHIAAPKFVTVERSASDEEKELFTALLYQCEAKNVMAICVVHNRGGPYLAKMLPYIRYGGFYLYRIAYFEQVNNLGEYLKEYVDGGEEIENVDEAGVTLMKKVVKKLKIPWDPFRFRNPKVQAQLSYIETLALDTVAQPQEDSTLPSTEMMDQRLGALVTAFEEMFGLLKPSDVKQSRTTAADRAETAEKFTKYEDHQIQGLVDTGRLVNCTVPVLKAMARSLGAATSGSKSDIIERITATFAAKNAS